MKQLSTYSISSVSHVKDNKKAILGVLLLLPLSLQASPQRWYNDAQVTQGKALYATQCAECHGVNAQSIPNWQQKTPEGKYPPPPLNGSAHAWHHSFQLLRRTINEGGLALGGQMPAFKDKLNEEQTNAVIASFQSYWSDEIYSQWQQRNPIKIEKKINTTTDKRLKWLTQSFPDIEIEKPPIASPAKGIQQLKMDSRYVYLLEGGKYLLVGDLYDLQKNENLTETLRKQDTQAKISTFPETDMVIYPAKGTEKAVITIFTDTDCPFCRRLHQQVPELQQAGVKVRYIAYPRGGKIGDTYKTMQSVWCAKDRAQAMSDAKHDIDFAGRTDCAGAKAVDAGYDLGNDLDIQGTPAIILPDGELISGYRPATELLQQLGLSPKL